jgi:hypothetical protein
MRPGGWHEPRPLPHRRAAVAEEVRWGRHQHGQATSGRCSPFHRSATGGQPLAFRRFPIGIGLAKLPPLSDDLRRLGCRADRGHFLSGAMEACIAAACPQAGRSSTAVGCLPQRALAQTRLRHRPLRTGHGTACWRDREPVDRRARSRKLLMSSVTVLWKPLGSTPSSTRQTSLASRCPGRGANHEPAPKPAGQSRRLSGRAPSPGFPPALA